jgi:aspartate aminotransferase
MLILNSPSNPTGLAYEARELKEISEVLLRHPDVALLTDDIYNHLYFPSEVAPHILQVCPRLKDRTVAINGASKSFAMTGWRLGWALAPRELIQSMNKYHTQTVSCANSIAQAAAQAALENGEPEVRRTVEDLKKRRDLALRGLREIPALEVFEPSGAFYFWIRVSGCLGKRVDGDEIGDSAAFCSALLQKELVATVPGNEFGMEGYLRASFAVSTERMAEAIRRTSSFISKLS